MIESRAARTLHTGEQLQVCAVPHGPGEWEFVCRTGRDLLEAVVQGTSPETLCVQARYRAAVNCEVLELPEPGAMRAAGLRLAAEGPPSAGHLSAHFRLYRSETPLPAAAVPDDADCIPLELMHVFLSQTLEMGRLIDPEIVAALYLLGLRSEGDALLPCGVIPDLPEAEFRFRGRYVGVAQRKGVEFAVRTRAEGAAIIPAMTEAGEVVLVEQYRPPVQRRVIEWPAGLIGDEGNSADAVATAERELLEETGYAAASFREVFRCPCAAQLSSEMLSFVVAEGLRKAGCGGGIAGEENITVHLVPRADLPRWLDGCRRRGLLVDPKVYTGLYFLERDARD